MSIDAKEFIAPRYAAHFQCIGASCEDPCCAGWEVPVDEAHYKKLKRRMDGSPSERDTFRRLVKRTRGPEQDRARYALLVLDNDQRCGFFDTDGLCALQKTYGSDALSDTCATYPRQIAVSGNRVELTAKVSCPEVARSLLLRRDAMELGDISSELIARKVAHHALPASAGDAYAQGLDVVRAAVLEVLADETYPVASRLATIACFADRITPFYRRGIARLDEVQLARAVDEIRHPALARHVHEAFESIHVRVNEPASLVLRTLGSRIDSWGAGLSQLVKDVFGEGARDARTELDKGAAERAIAAYEQSKTLLTGRLGGRIDGYFANYALNYFLQEWHFRSPSLIVHCKNLFLRIASIKFLLLSHPRVRELPDDIALADAESTLDRAAVEVFYKFARGVEHNTDFLRRLEADLDEKAPTLERALLLLKF